MFIIESQGNNYASKELRGVFEKIDKAFGFIPPHFELFATIDKEAFLEFIAYQHSMMHHRAIDAVLLPFLRLYIAHKEQRTYCQAFNTKLLRSKNINEVLIADVVDNIEHLPVALNQRLLAQAVITALYNPGIFSADTITTLEALGFSHKDFFDLLHYCCDFMSKSKMIEIYLQKGI